MLFLLSLFSLVTPAYAGIYLEYDFSRFTEGTCTPIKVEVGRQVGRIAIGAGFIPGGDEPTRHEVASVRDDANSMEVCWPDQVGRNGDFPTTLTILEDFNPGTGPAPAYWVVADWTAKTHFVNTEFGVVLVTISSSRAITRPK